MSNRQDPIHDKLTQLAAFCDDYCKTLNLDVRIEIRQHRATDEQFRAADATNKFCSHFHKGVHWLKKDLNHVSITLFKDRPDVIPKGYDFPKPDTDSLIVLDALEQNGR